MNKPILWTALIATGLGLLGGYWLASEQSLKAPSPTEQVQKKALFYRHPMKPSVTSPVPAKDEMGMDYVPVYEQSGAGGHPAKQPEPDSETPTNKILYYRHPMGLPDTSPVPKKDSMGMDYIPVYAEGNEENESQLVLVSTEKIQRLGVKTAPVATTELAHTVRAVGIVETDERQLYEVTLRFDGFIEKIYANATGQSVLRGQPLLELYSPDLISAQHEYLAAKKSQTMLAQSQDWLQAGMKNLADSSLERLKNWGISAADLDRLQQGKVLKSVVVRAPASGVVMEKSAIAGARAMAGDTLFKIADLANVWIMAEVHEQDINLIRLGQSAEISLDAYPDRIFTGRVGFIYPTLNAQTRTAKIRIELANPDSLLKPMMYAQIEFHTQLHKALTVPRSSVLDSGTRTLVLVDQGNGRFEPRLVKIGMRDDEAVEILSGLQEHEQVVVSANFLIDAESSLTAALSALVPPGQVDDADCQENCEPHLPSPRHATPEMPGDLSGQPTQQPTEPGHKHQGGR